MRLDHPERDDAAWLKTLVAGKENGEIAIHAEPMEGVWDEIRPPGLLERLPARFQDLMVRNLPRGVDAATTARAGRRLRAEGVRVKIRVRRFDPGSDLRPRFEEFDVPGAPGESVLGMLQQIRESSDSTLAFRYGCRFKGCGLCTVEIDGRPLPACMIRAREGMEVGPLASFPVLRDLVIDRRPLVERFARWGLYLLPPEGEVSPASFEVPDAYGELAACTECLACMAGCPSFDLENRSFGGPLTFVKLAALHFDPRDGEDRGSRTRRRRLGWRPAAPVRPDARVR